MKKSTFFLFLLLTITVFSGFEMHKFYIGVYQVDYKLDKKAFQITSRIFIDDIEIALEKKFGKKIYLSTDKEIKDANILIASYFKENFKFSVNDKSQEMIFLTKEFEDDVLICYHKIPFTEKINSISITNGVVSIGYIDNANANCARSSGNKFELNLQTGSLNDNSNTCVGNTSGYTVSEVRKN